MDSSDDELFDHSHIPDSVFKTLPSTQPVFDVSTTNYSWESVNNSLISPCSFSNVATSTQKDKEPQTPAVGFIDHFTVFVQQKSAEKAFCDQSWDEMDDIMLNLSYDYPTNPDLGDNSMIHKAIEEEFQEIIQRQEEIELIHEEYYNGDPSISVVYSDKDEDFIVMPDMDWQGISFTED